MGLNKPNIDLSVDIAGLRLKNPVMTASGTFGYGEDFAQFFDISRLGAVVVKGLSLTPREGNPTPRIVETPSGMLNAIGLQNIGVKEFISKKLPFLIQSQAIVIANFFGDSDEEFVEVAEILDNTEGVHALELNISCPNKQAQWMNYGTDLNLMAKLISKIREVVRKKTLIVKLTPNIGDVKKSALVAQDSGAEALSLINTITGMVIDIKSRRPVLANNIGGLSGPAIRPIAVRMVWEVCQVVKIPVIGMGGIMNCTDALEFLIAGAKAVAVGTANFVNPLTTINIIDGLEKFLVDEGLTNIKDIIGTIRTHAIMSK
ncbi:MAG: dihydroorotate dehydrogenase [Thermodesulfovibrionales bacterium]|nr:dihydroorotate dehydrogenase [Thermodesulfovibrionales bacterium]